MNPRREILGLLFDLIEGRRDLRATVRRVQELVRQGDPELDQALVELAARRRALRERPAERQGPEEDTTAVLLLHPASGRRRPAGEREPLTPPDYRQAFLAVADRSAEISAEVDRELATAADQAQRLLDLRKEARERALQRLTPNLRTPSLVAALIDQAVTLRGTDVDFSLELTEAALLVARRLPSRVYPWTVRIRQVVRAEAHHANVLRVMGQLPAADSLWRLLTARLRRDPIDLPDEEAELRSLEASLRIDQREFALTERLLVRAERLYQDLGCQGELARVLRLRSKAAVHAGESPRALPLLRTAQAAAETAGDAPGFLAATFHLGQALISLGDLPKAAELIAAHRERFHSSEEPVDRWRFAWIEGWFARANLRFASAEQLFATVRNEMLKSRRFHDVALVTLDSAETFVAQGKWPEVRRQAAALEPVFLARVLHRESLMSLRLFQEAAAAGTLTAAGIADLRRFLVVGKRDPTFRFDPSRLRAAS